MIRRLRGPVLSLVVSALLLVAGSLVYHFDVMAAAGLVSLFVLGPLAGGILLSLLNLRKRFSKSERFVLGTTVGLTAAALVQWLAAATTGLVPVLYLLAIIVIGVLRVPRDQQKIVGAVFLRILPLAILFVLCYNVAGFHYWSDGSIVAHGLWGVDIPFLAGQVHGLRHATHLVDLHQSAIPWEYHDATYRVLALTTPEQTLDTLAWVAPIFGYTIMAVAVYAVADRLLKNRIAAIVTTILWFISGAITGGEQSSYALSPSFVFGTIFFAAFLIAFHEWRFTSSTKLGVLVLGLLIALSRFKLSTFMVAEASLGIVALLKLRRAPRQATMIFGFAFVAGLQLLAIGAPTNPLMPAGDFLVGAPLLGYANHLAKILHVSVPSINPVTHASLSIKSLLIIPYFAFHLLRFVALDPRLLIALIAGFFLVRRSAEPVFELLYVAIPIGFLLPVLYSPAWYPLALSFYAPLVGVQAAIMLTGVVVDRWMRRDTGKWTTLVGGLLLIASVAFNLRSMCRDVHEPAMIVSSELRSVLEDVETSGKHGTLSTRRYDLMPTDTLNDESFYWYSAISGEPVITEGAKYGSLLGAVADIDREKGLHRVKLAELELRIHRAENDWLFYSGDTSLVFSTIRKVPIRYLLERTSAGTPDERVHVDLTRIGRIVYQKGNSRIWQFY